MFPIPWNKAFRKKDGSLVNMEDIGGGSSDLPEYSSEDAGKVLGVTQDGTLAWVTVSGGSNYSKVTSSILRENPNVDIKEGE